MQDCRKCCIGSKRSWATRTKVWSWWASRSCCCRTSWSTWRTSCVRCSRGCCSWKKRTCGWAIVCGTRAWRYRTTRAWNGVIRSNSCRRTSARCYKSLKLKRISWDSPLRRRTINARSRLTFSIRCSGKARMKMKTSRRSCINKKRC